MGAAQGCCPYDMSEVQVPILESGTREEGGQVAMARFYKYKTRSQKAYDLAVRRREAEEKRHNKRLDEIDKMYWIAVLREESK